MKDWAEQEFERAGLKFHQGKPKGEYPLNDLLKLLKHLGLEVRQQQGSHTVVYHPGLHHWARSREGTFSVVRKHPGSKDRPMTLAIYVKIAFEAVVFLKQNGYIGNEQEDN